MISASPTRVTAILHARLLGALVFVAVYGTSAGLAQSANTQTWRTHGTSHFDIYYQSPQRGRVDAVAREAERAYARISFELRHELAERVPLILVRADRDLPHDEEQARALVVASGAPERDHLLMSVETFERRPDGAVAHELAHQFLFELLPRAHRDAPGLSEALPDHCSGSWKPSEHARLRDAVERGFVPAVEDLTPSDRHWGHALFDFVATEYGAQGIRRVLAALRDASTVAEAIPPALNVSPDDFNAAFQRYATKHLGSK